MRVQGRSMLPLLPEGARVVAVPVTPTTTLKVGDVVAARRPDRPQVELIKRISEIRDSGSYYLLGDNPLESTDSRHFGVVTQEHLTARVRWRYWPLPPRSLS
jgi:nickel-type superoxide dismutase maturation protease